MYKLVIQDDEGKTTIVPLIRDEITIGRKEGNTIRLTERNVSRRHARIVRFDGVIQIEDLGSYNGVRVNGAKIAQRTALSVSDRAQIGDYLIEVKAEVVEPAAPPTAVDDGRTIPNLRTLPSPGGDPTQHLAAVSAFATAPTLPGASAAPVTALDDAPTTRASAAATASPTTTAARLVVLSSNFAGQEWRLTGAQTVIGRTDENDVVINHRSISRNHAKVVREADTGRYTISDLQSSNGVRVNGEEYGKVELRRGDIVDLGHVRLRFVEAGEDFLFGRDAQVAEVPTGSGNRTMVIAALAVLLIGGGIAAYKLVGGKKPTTQLAAVGSGSAGSGSGTALAVALGSGSDGSGSGSAGPQLAVAGMDARGPDLSTGELAKQLTECRAMVEKEDWVSLKLCAKDALALDGTNAEATALMAQGAREANNSSQFDMLGAANRKKNYAVVAEAYGKIDTDSIYRERARAITDAAHDAYRTQQVASATSLANRGKCSEINSLAAASSKVWSDVGAAVKGVACKQAEDPPQQACNYEALILVAEDAGQRSEWGAQIKAAEAAIACNGSTKRPKQLVLMAACKSGNKAKFDKYYKSVGASTPVGLLSACLDMLPK